jgi:transcriptional regulator with XRE-family HTH domain
MPNANSSGGGSTPDPHRQLRFADQLRRHRASAGLTQEMLAERAGLSARAISDLERGAHQAPQHATVQLLVAALGLSPPDAERFAAAANRRRHRMAFAEPTTRALGAAHGRLPASLSSFVGRQDEVTQLDRLLSIARLVTLTGAGGVGKTRLALQVAAASGNRWGSLCFVDLSPLIDPALLPQALASALEVREEPGRHRRDPH